MRKPTLPLPTLLTLFLPVLGACVGQVAGGDPGARSDDLGGCPDPRYGDGVCDLDLECEAPDIDCFVLFDSESEAAAWYLSFEELLAAEQRRPPRSLMAAGDPRFQAMRELLDRGWDAYRATIPVADLAMERPALVVVEDPEVNAFVAPDLETGKSGFAVIVQSGVLDLGASDAKMLGLVMHELEHAVRLHVMPEVKERIRRFYVARYGEPFGFEQPDDPLVREHAEAWRQLATEAGSFTIEALGGLPFGSSQLQHIFFAVIAEHEQLEPCLGPVAELDELLAELDDRISPLDGGLELEETFRYETDWVLLGLRDVCLPSLAPGFVEVVANMAGVTPEQIRSALSPEDLALVEGVHFIDAIRALTLDRRARMRSIEDGFVVASGRPWSAVRFYSYEEQADDVTVPVLAELGLHPAGLAGFLFDHLLVPEMRSACGELLDAGETPPYGVDLLDEHHASCWRIDHIAALAASGKLVGEPTPGAAKSAVPAFSGPRPGLPLPMRYSDLIVY